ncbi:sensor histidine kinase [Marinifilum caeruleilacunae]|nr:sensor histidine kinase [Marinifilum caeruleilacunae]
MGQQRPYINYTTHDGLPQIQVMAVHQDKTGYIWAGTKSGLVKFNGERFEHFLPKKRIYNIYSDNYSRVYVQTYNELYRYDGQQIKLMAKFRYQSAIRLANDLEYWVLSPDALVHYKDTIALHTYQYKKDLPGIMNSIAWNKKDGKLYLGVKNQKKILSIDNGKVETVNYQTKADEIAVNSLGDQLVFIEHYGSNLKWINPQTKEEYFTIYKSNNVVDSISVKSLPVKKHIHFNDYSYYLIDSLTNTGKKVKLDFIKAPYPVIFDEDDNIWSGSDNGLYQVFNGPVKNYPRSFMNDVWTLIKGRNKEIYGAVYKEALYKYDLENEQKTEIIAPGQFGRKETDYYYGSSMDAKGNLYFPTHYGLVKYDYRKAKKFDTGISLISKYDSISNQVVFGQMHGFGFIDENEKISYVQDSTKQFVTSHPAALEFDAEGNIWIGTKASLCKWDRKKKAFSQAISCPSRAATVIQRDFRNNIWLGGKDGLWLFDEQSRDCKRVDKGIINSNITGIIIPNQHYLIVGTSLEIYVMDLKAYYETGEIRMRLFNFRNGFLSEEVCQNGFMLDGNRLFIPSTTSTSVLDLEKIDFNPEFYNVRITSLNDLGIQYVDSVNRSEIILEKGKNELDFGFETVGFGLPTKPVFRYKLSGVDKDWSEWTTKTYANYRNLSSGEYRFQVMARAGGNPNIISYKEDSIKVKVSNPFYKEPRFYQHSFFGFVFLVLILGFFVHSRFHIKLKMIDRERKIKLLEIATLQAQLNPHFIFNILSSVQNLISLHKQEKANEYLIKFSRLIRSYMEASIKSSKVLLGTSVSSEISVKEEIDLLKMYIELEQVKHGNEKFDFSIEISSDSILNRSIPPMILQPLVENAIKHGLEPKEEKGFLSIQFSEHEDSVECIILDDGIGRERSNELKRDSIKLYQSRGLEMINKKIEILNDLDYQISIDYRDSAEGTEVRVKFTNE